MLTALHQLIARLDGEAVKEAVQVEKELAAEAKAELAALLADAAKVAPRIAAFGTSLDAHMPAEFRPFFDEAMAALVTDVEKLLGSQPAA